MLRGRRSAFTRAFNKRREKEENSKRQRKSEMEKFGTINSPTDIPFALESSPCYFLKFMLILFFFSHLESSTVAFMEPINIVSPAGAMHLCRAQGKQGWFTTSVSQLPKLKLWEGNDLLRVMWSQHQKRMLLLHHTKSDITSQIWTHNTIMSSEHTDAKAHRPTSYESRNMGRRRLRIYTQSQHQPLHS